MNRLALQTNTQLPNSRNSRVGEGLVKRLAKSRSNVVSSTAGDGFPPLIVQKLTSIRNLFAQVLLQGLNSKVCDLLREQA